MSETRSPDQNDVPDGRKREWPLVWLVICVAAALTLPNLGSSLLWQDEAQTALISGTILDHGMPLGTDGTNFFSQKLGKEYAANHLWRGHTWLPFYATAAAFAVFGENTLSARLPFALFGIGCAALSALLALAWFRDRVAALAAGLLCATSVPFLLFSRQCGYYTMATFFCLLALWGYARLGKSKSHAATAVVFLATLAAFHTHYVYCATLLASLGLHALLFERDKLLAVMGTGAGTALVNLPWILWFRTARPGGNDYFATVFDGEKLIRFSSEYFELLADYFIPLGWLALPFILLAWRLFKREPLSLPAQDRAALGLLGIYAAVSIGLLSALSPTLFYRDLAPLAPACFLLAGWLFAAIYRRQRALAIFLALLTLATGRIDRHVTELITPVSGPMEGLVSFLTENAHPNDKVAISYGDMPLKFYTSHRVLGGLTGEPLDELSGVRWWVMRRHANTDEEARLKARFRDELDRAPERSVRHVLPAPDTPFQNREDPRLHRFKSAGEEFPRVLVFERKL